MPLAAYCTAADVQAATSRWATFDSSASTRVDLVIPRAQAFVDQATSSWFNDRQIIVKTQTIVPGQTKLFMPAPVISVSALTENGSALNVASQVFIYGTWLEKVASNPLSLTSCSWPAWSPGQQNIVVTGHFGYSTVPTDIAQATAHITGMMLGMIERDYTGGDGAAHASILNTLPDWIKAILASYKRVGLQTQPFLITAVP